MPSTRQSRPREPAEDAALARALGAGCRQARAGLGMTQRQVAERCGMSREYYARIERGLVLPSVPRFVVLSEVLGVSADELLGGAQAFWPRAHGGDSPQVEHVLDMIRCASAETVRLVGRILPMLEKAERERNQRSDAPCMTEAEQDMDMYSRGPGENHQ